MDYQKVKGLNCNLCTISSCTTAAMRTPVSKVDATVKDADLSRLEYDEEKRMFYIKKGSDNVCSFYDKVSEKCELPLHKRFNSCLIFPVRIYLKGGVDYLILNKNCPSATSLFDMVARREPSAVNYVISAAKIFSLDKDYRAHVYKNTENFTDILLLGVFSVWSNREYMQ